MNQSDGARDSEEDVTMQYNSGLVADQGVDGTKANIALSGTDTDNANVNVNASEKGLFPPEQDENTSGDSQDQGAARTRVAAEAKGAEPSDNPVTTSSSFATPSNATATKNPQPVLPTTATSSTAQSPASALSPTLSRHMAPVQRTFSPPTSSLLTTRSPGSAASSMTMPGSPFASSSPSARTGVSTNGATTTSTLFSSLASPPPSSSAHTSILSSAASAAAEAAQVRAANPVAQVPIKAAEESISISGDISLPPQAAPTPATPAAMATEAGTGTGTGTTSLAAATENIDPVASYSAWRKKKDTETLQGTQAVMESFLRQHSAYDVLPVSYRQIVLDTTLLVKKALSVLMQYNIVSAPLWDSTRRKFAGMLTATDFINLIQFYYSHSSYVAAGREMDLFQIYQLRDVEKVIGVPPPELFSLHPLQSLYDACQLLVESRAHRLPLVDVDSETGEEMIVSVLTQYRILKFIAMNYQDEKTLRQPLSELKIGIYTNLATADLSTPVMEVIDMFVKRRISSVPIVDEEGVVLNVFETVDVMTLVKAGVYRDLDLCVAEALLRRPEDFAGVHTCTLNDSLSSIFGTIRKSQVHRLIVVDSGNKLKGIVSLSDIMRYLIGGSRTDRPVSDVLAGSGNEGDDEQDEAVVREGKEEVDGADQPLMASTLSDPVQLEGQDHGEEA